MRLILLVLCFSASVLCRQSHHSSHNNRNADNKLVNSRDHSYAHGNEKQGREKIKETPIDVAKVMQIMQDIIGQARQVHLRTSDNPESGEPEVKVVAAKEKVGQSPSFGVKVEGELADVIEEVAVEQIDSQAKKPIARSEPSLLTAVGNKIIYPGEGPVINLEIQGILAEKLNNMKLSTIDLPGPLIQEVMDRVPEPFPGYYDYLLQKATGNDNRDDNRYSNRDNSNDYRYVQQDNYEDNRYGKRDNYNDYRNEQRDNYDDNRYGKRDNYDDNRYEKRDNYDNYRYEKRDNYDDYRYVKKDNYENNRYGERDNYNDYRNVQQDNYDDNRYGERDNYNNYRNVQRDNYDDNRYGKQDNSNDYRNVQRDNYDDNRYGKRENDDDYRYVKPENYNDYRYVTRPMKLTVQVPRWNEKRNLVAQEDRDTAFQNLNLENHGGTDPYAKVHPKLVLNKPFEFNKRKILAKSINNRNRYAKQHNKLVYDKPPSWMPKTKLSVKNHQPSKLVAHRPRWNGHGR